jgi:hypothetical protein
MFRTILGVAASPLVAIALFCAGILTATLHLLALPALYLWERYLEQRPLAGKQDRDKDRIDSGRRTGR